MKNRYSISEIISNAHALILTKIFYKGARLIRRPFYIRGKKGMQYDNGLTTGHGCRFDLNPNKKSLIIGKNCKLGDYVHIVALERVEIGDNCLMASKVFISDTSHGEYQNGNMLEIAPDKRPLISKKVKIGDNVWIGENVVILSGVSIGNGAVIGANSVVTHDINDYYIAYGVPAKIGKRMK